MSNKTYVACRPGMKAAAEAAFTGIEVVVDDSLSADWEFRQRELTFDEILEEEISKEERVEADPKNAKTFIVPVGREDDVSDQCWSLSYLAVRVPDAVPSHEVIEVVKNLKPTLTGSFPDQEINRSATIGALKADLKKAGIEVHSISEAFGLIPLDY